MGEREFLSSEHLDHGNISGCSPFSASKPSSSLSSACCEGEENKTPQMFLKDIKKELMKQCYADVLWGLQSLSVTFPTLPCFPLCLCREHPGALLRKPPQGDFLHCFAFPFLPFLQNPVSKHQEL